MKHQKKASLKAVLDMFCTDVGDGSMHFTFLRFIFVNYNTDVGDDLCTLLSSDES